MHFHLIIYVDFVLDLFKQITWHFYEMNNIRFLFSLHILFNSNEFSAKTSNTIKNNPKIWIVEEFNFFADIIEE